ncbi:MAG: hypothetical protein WCJ03_06725 [Bacteroidales bacterium]
MKKEKKNNSEKDSDSPVRWNNPRVVPLTEEELRSLKQSTKEAIEHMKKAFQKTNIPIPRNTNEENTKT